MAYNLLPADFATHLDSCVKRDIILSIAIGAPYADIVARHNTLSEPTYLQILLHLEKKCKERMSGKDISEDKIIEVLKIIILDAETAQSQYAATLLHRLVLEQVELGEQRYVTVQKLLADIRNEVSKEATERINQQIKLEETMAAERKERTADKMYIMGRSNIGLESPLVRHNRNTPKRRFEEEDDFITPPPKKARLSHTLRIGLIKPDGTRVWRWRQPTSMPTSAGLYALAGSLFELIPKSFVIFASMNKNEGFSPESSCVITEDDNVTESVANGMVFLVQTL